MAPVSEDATRIAELEAEVARLGRMLEGAPNFITWVSTQGKLLYVNRLAPGFSLDDVVGQEVFTFLPAAFHERLRKALRDAVETGELQELVTYGAASADHMGHYLTRISPLVEDGEVTSAILVATDITEHEARRIRLELAMEATGLGIWTLDAATQSGEMDAKTREIFGIGPGDPASTLEEMLRDGIHPDDREMVSARVREALVTGVYRPIEHRITRSDGTTVWVQASGTAVRDGAGNVVGLVGGIMDITDRRTMETRLAEAQKLESIGRLAGGIAHDFNNMLTAILGNVDYLLQGEAGPAETTELLGEVRVGAQRSAALTSQLLAFARRQIIAPAIVDPNQLIRRLGALFGRVVGEQVELSVSLEARGSVEIDPSQFEQVVLNLLTNARDALPQGGRVTLRTRDVKLDAELAPDLEPGEYVCISVIDTGPGIEVDALPRVFEPFYSTRSGGTGLGLATCYGIVKQNGGHIVVRNDPGGGATFEVYLTRARGVAEELEDGEVRRPDPGGSESVLVVEDEALVRRLLVRTLRDAGYRVQQANDAEAALVLARGEGPFDLLVTDVLMPGASGVELGRRLREAGSVAAVLYVSGYPGGRAPGDAKLDESATLLQKPFLPRDLLVAVRARLDAR